jgi:esterase/lipase superfamily enzyme
MDPPGMHVGWEEVALGPQHVLGRMDAAVAITPRFEQTQSSVTANGNPLNRSDATVAAFAEGDLRRAIRASQPPRAGQPRQVLCFVHGYNNTFDDAVRKAAQLAGDLEMVDCDGNARGVAVAYSWPAQGTLLSYLADEENAEWSQQRFVPFLQSLARVCQQERAELHLVAHSMGSRLLIRSMADLANSGRTHPIGHVILLAPDMAKSLFDQYLQRMLPLVQHLTIYVSARDQALSFSRILHGGHDRLGLIESTLFTALSLTGLTGESHRELGPSPEAFASGKVDMIDVSKGIAGQFGHNYEDPGFIRDLRELIYNDTRAGTGGRANLEPRTAATDLFHSLSREKVKFFQLKR